MVNDMRKIDFSALENKGLVRRKNYPNGLSVVKYKAKVFYENLWGVDEKLLQARGIVLDHKDRIVVQPFYKVFNINENGTTINPEKVYQVIDKINGFMFCVTKHGKEVIYSTTGTLDSEFVELGKKNITSEQIKNLPQGITFIFEVCDESDKHPIEEKLGIHLIGACNVKDHRYFEEWELDIIAKQIKCFRPKHSCMLGRDILAMARHSKIEGYMLRDNAGNFVMKIKTPYYLFVKFASRCNVDRMYDCNWKQSFDEEYYPVIQKIHEKYSRLEWAEMSKDDRLLLIREIIYEWRESEEPIFN